MKTLARVTWVAGVGALLVLVAGSAVAFGRVKLTTLPERERVEIQLDNLNATLVEEERIVTLLKGTNHIDFSWTSTAIDKGTIQFRVVEMPLRRKRRGDPASIVRPDGKVEQIQIVHVAYPPGENALVWQVYAEKPFAARIRISYLIRNLQQTFSYRAVAEHDESHLVLRKYIRLDNYSGEEFGASGIWAGFGNYFHREVGFNEAKKMLIWKYTQVPVEKTYTFAWWTGQKVPDEPQQRYVEMRYVLANDAKHNMGKFPLQPGKVRIFQKDGHGGEAFIGEDWGGFTPIDDEMKLYLGLARDVVIRRKIMKNKAHAIRGNLYNREVIVEYAIENFKSTALTLDIAENMNRLRDSLCGRKGRNAEWEILKAETNLPRKQIERKSVHELELHVPLVGAPKDKDEKVKKVTVRLHVMFKNEW